MLMRGALLCAATLLLVGTCNCAVISVGSAEELSTALSTATGEVELSLTAHISVIDDIILDNVTSLAIWGACTTPATNATNPTPGMCELALGQYNIVAKNPASLDGTYQPSTDWVRLYLDNLFLSYTGGIKLELKYTTFWLVSSELAGFQGIGATTASVYIIGSTITEVPLGVSVTLDGADMEGVPSESTLAIVSSTMVSQKVAYVQLGPESEEGYVYVYKSNLTGSVGDDAFSLDAGNGTLNVYNDTNVNFYAIDNTTVPQPLTPAVWADWTYGAANLQYLTALDTAGAPHAKDALPLASTAAPNGTAGTASPGSSASTPVATSAKPPPASGATSNYQRPILIAAAVLVVAILQVSF